MKPEREKRCVTYPAVASPQVKPVPGRRQHSDGKGRTRARDQAEGEDEGRRISRREEAELDRVRREAKELSDRLPKFDPRSVQPGARSGAGRVDDAVRRAFESDGRSMIERGLRTSNCWGLARSRRADLSVRRRASRVHVSDAGELPKGAP